jgi:predicted tellurium resistance membrane protein TerC
MPNVRRFTILCLICCLLLPLLVGAGDPQPASPLKLKVERPNTAPTEAIAEFTTIRLTSPYGLLDLDLSKVKVLTIEKVEEIAGKSEVLVSAEMRDHSRMSGQLLTPTLPITLDKKAESLIPVTGLRIRFQHPMDSGLLAALIGLLTLTVMEIVLGVDNIIFLTIVAGKLPEAQQPQAQRIGLAAALGTRLLLLVFLSLLMGATHPLFTLPELPFLRDIEARNVSIRDLVLLLGGLFLIGKSAKEIHEKIEMADEPSDRPVKRARFLWVILEIAAIDIIFSLDSVITAVGMVDDLWVMVAAMIIAVAVMIAFAEPIRRFVNRNPSIKVLALSFLILIGALLVAESLGQHMDKGYIYFAMAFAMVIELINMRLRRTSPPATAGSGI